MVKQEPVSTKAEHPIEYHMKPRLGRPVFFWNLYIDVANNLCCHRFSAEFVCYCWYCCLRRHMSNVKWTSSRCCAFAFAPHLSYKFAARDRYARALSRCAVHFMTSPALSLARAARCIASSSIARFAARSNANMASSVFFFLTASSSATRICWNTRQLTHRSLAAFPIRLANLRARRRCFSFRVLL